MLLLPIFLRPVQPCRFGPQSTRILGLEENALFVVVICSEVASSDADFEARPQLLPSRGTNSTTQTPPNCPNMCGAWVNWD